MESSTTSQGSLRQSARYYDEDELRASFEAGFPPARKAKSSSLGSLGAVPGGGRAGHKDDGGQFRTSNGEEQVVVSFEGNIGSGKSTLLGILREALGPGAEVIQEPIGLWTNVNGQDLLKASYVDPDKYRSTFQCFAFASRLQAQAKTPREAPVRLLERSCETDPLFAKQSRADGYIDDINFAAYEYISKAFAEVVPGAPQGMVYLKVPPSVCFKRKERRKRDGEEGVSLEYLEAMDKQHVDFFEETDLPFITIDATVAFDRPGPSQDKVVADIVAFCAEIAEKRASSGSE